MKPKSIYLLRHGQSLGNINWQNYLKFKDHDIPLTDTGLEQAKVVAVELKKMLKGQSVATYSSHYQRAQHTLHTIHQQLGDAVKFNRTDPDLRELKWMGDNIKIDRDIQMDMRKKMGMFTAFNEGGESAQDVWNRMGNVVVRLHEEFKEKTYPKNAIIVSHGIAIRVFLIRFLNWSTDEYEHLANPRNCQVFRLDLNEEKEYKLATPFPII